MDVFLGILMVLAFMVILFLIMNAIGTFLYRVISGETEPEKPVITAEDVQRFALMLERFTYFKDLSKEGKRKFLQRMVEFMISKHFDGRDGLQLTEQMKVYVSASATQLLFGLDEHRLTSFFNIRIFPSIFYSRLMNVHMKGGTTRGGVIMLSWKDFLAGYADEHDKLNLGLHEFAHALRIEVDSGDDYSGAFATYMEHWDRISYETFKMVRANEVPFLRKYAGTNSQEFWAVCVEHFFEAPEEFNKQLPKIYRYMCVMLNQDPANIHNDYAVDKEVVPSAKELILSSPELETEREPDPLKLKMNGDPFLIFAFILMAPLASGVFEYSKMAVIGSSMIYLIFLLNSGITLFLAKRFVIPKEKISIPTIFKSLVLGGALGTFAFLFINASFAEPLPIEIYKVNNVLVKKGNNGRQIGYVVEVEGKAYSDHEDVRMFTYDPLSRYVKFEFASGFLGIKVLLNKGLCDENGADFKVPTEYDEMMMKLDSLTDKGDTAAIRKMFYELGHEHDY